MLKNLHAPGRKIFCPPRIGVVGAAAGIGGDWLAAGITEVRCVLFRERFGSGFRISAHLAGQRLTKAISQ